MTAWSDCSPTRRTLLKAEPARLEATSRELVNRYGFRRLFLERLLLDAMRAEAARLGGQRSVVLAADADGRRGAAWHRLQVRVQRARPVVERALANLEVPTLLQHPGLLARYGLLGLLQPLQAAHGRGR